MKYTEKLFFDSEFSWNDTPLHENPKSFGNTLSAVSDTASIACAVDVPGEGSAVMPMELSRLNCDTKPAPTVSLTLTKAESGTLAPSDVLMK